jgi:hypothetical protein
MKPLKKWVFVSLLFIGLFVTTEVQAKVDGLNHPLHYTSLSAKELPKVVNRFLYDSGLHFEYPDAVRGIYVTGYSAGGNKFNQLVDYLDKTDLNAMVIDFKDD